MSSLMLSAMLSVPAMHVCCAGMDIGNGYGVVGGGAYGEAEMRRRGSFSLAAEPAFLANPGRDRSQGATGSKWDQDKKGGDSGAQPGGRASPGAEAASGASPGAGSSAKGTPKAIPEFLAQRLRARGILKDSAPSSASDAAQV